MSHTPGPWDRNIRPARKYPIIFSGRNTHVAQIISRPDDSEIEANCNLISAAPDLLAALQAIFQCGDYDDDGDFFLPHEEWDGKCDPPDTSDNPALLMARAAIAKATGKP